MAKAFEKPAFSPFDLTDDGAYLEWRDAKLESAHKLKQADFVEIRDPLAMADSEIAALLEQCETTNMALYRIPPVEDDSRLRELLRAMAEQLGMGLPEGHRSAGNQGIVALTVSNRPSQRGFIPYTRKPLNWHTDGYYNGPETAIRSFVLHCVMDATTGGENQVLDTDIAYIRLRDENPDYIRALMHPGAMTIPENVEEDGSVRPASVGPVYWIDDSGRLAMRYTARTRSIEWRDDADTRGAESFLRQLLVDGDPLMRQFKLKPGEGVINNNVLHNRTGFDPDETGNSSRRVVYRVRFLQRVGEKTHG